AYSDVKYTATIEVMYRDDRDLAAQMIALSRDLSRSIDKDIERVLHSELAEVVYQGPVSRGNSRKVHMGQAGQQEVYLFLPKKDLEQVLDKLKAEMPGVNVASYLPKVLLPNKRAASYMAIARLVVEYLLTMPSSTTEVSIRQLKKDLASQAVAHEKVWSKAK